LAIVTHPRGLGNPFPANSQVIDALSESCQLRPLHLKRHRHSVTVELSRVPHVHPRNRCPCLRFDVDTRARSGIVGTVNRR